MGNVKFSSDRTIFSTHNNGFAGAERDENLVEEDLMNTEIPLSDRIPEEFGEQIADNRPVYDEEGYRHSPGE